MEEIPVYDKILIKDEEYHNKLEGLRKDIERLTEYNLDLKLQVIEAKDKLHKILSIINK